jgi:hypothetical protein
LLEIRRQAEQSMYPPTAKGVLAKNPPAMIVDWSRNYGKEWNNWELSNLQSTISKNTMVASTLDQTSQVVVYGQLMTASSAS